jgi:hypothetical protein
MEFSPCGRRVLTARLDVVRNEEAITMKASQLRSLASQIAAAVAEMNEAQRRMTMLRLAPDRYLIHPDEAPATYDEFLARTSGPLAHEPRASRRAQR